MKASVLSALALLLVTAAVRADPPGAVDRILMAGGFVGTVNDDAGSPVDRVELGRDATDADLAGLCELRHLQSLYLRHTHVTEDGLRAVAGLPRLRRLGLCGANVTDQGLGHLGAMRGLKELEVFKCPNVTDQGLRHLEALSQLESLDLRGCPKVTDQGVGRLRKALPNCEIRR